MGIEGERLVLDYLSRVGDLAHGTQMSAQQRATLVNGLRDEIGRQRAAAGGAESGAQVKRILGRMGRPEEVVAAAAERDGTSAAAQPPVPEPRPSGGGRTPARTPRRARSEQPPAREAATARPVPGPSAAERPPAAPRPSESAADREGPGVPLGDGGPDGGLGPGGGGFGGGLGAAGGLGGGLLDKRSDDPSERQEPWPDGQIGRFFGGIEIPEMLRAPAAPPDADPGDALDPEAAAEAEKAVREAVPDPAVPRRRRWARAALSGRRVGGPVEYLAALLLVAGTVAGEVVVLGLGWLAAYWSPRLSRRLAQWATFGMPAVVVGGYLLWLFGRSAGYWGGPLADGDVEAAFADHWPWLLRGAALASAAFLLYRARRPRPAAEG
ncbi:hypothetical protein [Streptomyces marincola]|uniref:Uncharacterized protein n=1 Tax=Streptomyces marincola TaxID=2878388 RepID=A0A1W7CZ89_9ACTN|nr:hypothetical protein [Streptomyces marincola]ARQ70102.1 hypothetical protein CAG99_15725 [Streptomyces marincola]